MVQAAPAASEAPQVLVWAKSPASVPDNVIPLIVRVVVPTFVRVMVLAPLVVPTVTLPKLRLVGDSLAVVPTPLKLTFCGLPPALSEIFKVAV
jgi:hypothetical protein